MYESRSSQFDIVLQMALTDAVCADVFVSEDLSLTIGFGPAVVPDEEVKPDPDRPGAFLYRRLVESPYALGTEDSKWEIVVDGQAMTKPGDSEAVERQLRRILLGVPVSSWRVIYEPNGIDICFAGGITLSIRPEIKDETLPITSWAVRVGQGVYWTSQSDGETFVADDCSDVGRAKDPNSHEQI